MTPEKISVSVFASGTIFPDCRGAWEKLLQDSESATLFLTWDWLSSWWECYGKGAELLVLQAHKGDRLVGVAPLYVREVKKWGFYPNREVRFLGDGSADSDYLDFIVVKGEEGDVIPAFLGYLHQHRTRWDLLSFNEIPEKSPNCLPLKTVLSDRGYRVALSDSRCVRAVLDESWDAYLKGLRPRLRTKIRSLQRNFESAFRTELLICTTEEEARERLPSLFDLHTRRWAVKYQDGVFRGHEKRDFYHSISRTFLRNGWLRFYSLTADGRFVAHQFCFEYGGEMLLLQEGYDPEFESWEVGNLLRALVFQDCIRRGIRVYDFLGGVSFHKLSWGNLESRGICITCGPRGIATLLGIAIPSGRERMKEKIKKFIPERWIDMRQRYREKRVRSRWEKLRPGGKGNDIHR